MKTGILSQIAQDLIIWFDTSLSRVVVETIAVALSWNVT